MAYDCNMETVGVRVRACMKIHVYSTLAKLVVKEEKKENPYPIHYTRTVQTRKHKMTRTHLGAQP